VATSFLVYALAEGMDVRYVGYTARPDQRRRKHLRLHPTWRWLVLGAYPSAAVGLEQERWWIKRLYDKGHPLTNKSDGGTPGFTKGHSEISRRKMSIAKKGLPAWNKGRPLSPETRAKLSAALKGKKAWNKGVPNTAQKGKPISAEQKAKISASNKGKKRTPEMIARLSEAHLGQPAWNKGIPNSPEARRKISMALKGRIGHRLGKKHSLESLAKMSRAHRGATHSEETRAKMSVAHKGNQYSLGRRHTAETKAKMSVAHKGRAPSPQCIAASIRANTGKPKSVETRAKISATKRQRSVGA